MKRKTKTELRKLRNRLPTADYALHCRLRDILTKEVRAGLPNCATNTGSIRLILSGNTSVTRTFSMWWKVNRAASR